MVALRPITSTNSPLGDQAVSFVIDGVQVGRASVRRMAPNVGVRLAGFYSRLNGWSHNDVPESSRLRHDYDKAPRTREFAIRGTVKAEFGDRFTARAKLSYNRTRGTDATANVHFVNCAGAQPQTGGGTMDDCKADDHVTVGKLGPNFGLVEPRFGNGDTFLRQNQTLGGLELNYALTDTVALAAVTGYYRFELDKLSDYPASYNPATVLASRNELRVRELSQEVRASSSFSGSLNFLIGAFVQDTRGINGALTYFNATTPAFINN